MGVDKLEEGNKIGDILNEIRSLLPDTAEYIEVLFETLRDFEGVDFYERKPSEIATCVGDIDEVAVGVLTCICEELRKVAPENSQKIKDAFQELHTLLSERPNVYKYFLRGIFEHLGLTTQGLEVEDTEAHVYKKFRVPNMLLSKTDHQRFFNALGLKWVRNSGKGEHEKWIDPKAEMSGFALASGGNKLWLKNIIKDSLKKGMPLERIKAACRKCNIRFEEK